MEVDFVKCPKCLSRNWSDIPDTNNINKTKFKCIRCNYIITLGSCSKCKTVNAWILITGINDKGGQKPFYRFQCKICKRIVGILLG